NDFGHHVGAVAVNQTVFGSSGHVQATDDPVIFRFVRRAADNYAEHEWFKSIVRVEAADSFDTQHAVRLHAASYVLGDGMPFAVAGKHPGRANRIAGAGLRLHHYMLKSLDEFRLKQARGAVSDRPKEGYKRFTNDYFFKRQENTNRVLDETLLPL